MLIINVILFALHVLLFCSVAHADFAFYRLNSPGAPLGINNQGEIVGWTDGLGLGFLRDPSGAIDTFQIHTGVGVLSTIPRRDKR
jgi:hypothetical protein